MLSFRQFRKNISRNNLNTKASLLLTLNRDKNEAGVHGTLEMLGGLLYSIDHPELSRTEQDRVSEQILCAARRNVEFV